MHLRSVLQAALTGCLAGVAAYDISYWVSAFTAAPLAQDTSIYYLAAQIGLEQGWSRIYDLSLQAQFFAGLQLGFPQSDFFLFANPPPMAWLVAPLTAIPPVGAYLVIVAISVTVVIGAGLMVGTGSGRARAVLILAAFAWYPVIYSLRLGQVALLVGFVVVLCWWLDQRGRAELAGLALGLIAIKPQLALLVAPCLLLAGRRRLFVSWLVAMLILVFVSLLSLGVSGLTQYANVLTRLHADVYNERYTLASLGAGPVLTIVLQAIVAVVTLVAAYRNRHRGTAAVIALALIGGILAAPYVHVDDFAVLVPAAWLLARESRSVYQRVWLFPAAVAMELAWLLGPLPILATLTVSLLLFFLPSRRSAPAMMPQAA